MTVGVVLLFGGVLALGVGGTEPAVATGGLGDIDCPRTTTTTAGASTTSTTLDPRCLILGTGATKKQIAAADEAWFGEIHTDGHAGGCTNSWDGFILVVVNDEKITKPSAGFVETTGQERPPGPGCYGSTPYLEPFDVRGRASEKRLRLKFIDPTDVCYGLAAPDGSVRLACWGVPGGSVARGTSRVSGTFTTDLGLTVFETTVELSKF